MIAPRKLIVKILSSFDGDLIGIMDARTGIHLWAGPKTEEMKNMVGKKLEAYFEAEMHYGDPGNVNFPMFIKLIRMIDDPYAPPDPED